MIEMCTYGARAAVERMKHYAASPSGIFLYAVIPAIIGIIILLAFMSVVLSPAFLPAPLPFIISFNSAAAGYGLVDKGGDTYPRRRSVLVIIALVLTVTGCSVLTMFCPWERLVDVERYVVCTSSALAFSFFGAWIASKSRKLNLSS